MLQQQWDDPLAGVKAPTTAKTPIPVIPAVKPDAKQPSDITEFEAGTNVPEVVSHSSTPTPPPSASGELGTAGLGQPPQEDAQPTPLSGGYAPAVYTPPGTDEESYLLHSMPS